MSTKGGTGSFWTSLPGILTGIAAVITAVVGLYAALGPGGSGDDGGSEPRTAVVTTDSPVVTPDPSGPPPPPPSDPPPPAPPAGMRVVEAMLRADPFEYEGPCPVTIRFTGRISVAGGDGTVTYRFLRSDGASAPVRTLAFDGPGSQDVETTWQLGKDYSGWQQVRILDPADTLSNRAEFEIRCR